MSDNHKDFLLDVKGLLCPLPVLKAAKRLRAMESGTVLKVVATDPMSAVDMPHFCGEQGYELLSQHNHDNIFEFRIKRP